MKFFHVKPFTMTELEDAALHASMRNADYDFSDDCVQQIITQVRARPTEYFINPAVRAQLYFARFRQEQRSTDFRDTEITYGDPY